MRPTVTVQTLHDHLLASHSATEVLTQPVRRARGHPAA